VGLNHAPKTQPARAFPIELAGNSAELRRSADTNCSKTSYSARAVLNAHPQSGPVRMRTTMLYTAIYEK